MLGVDVGGTSIKAGVVQEGRVLDSLSMPTPMGAAGVVGAVAELFRELVAGRDGGGRVAAAGVVVPGIVDERAGRGVLSENLRWRDVPLQRMLQAVMDVPVAFGHDVRAGALAEYDALEGPRPGVMLFVPIGTGIAAATVIQGEILVAGGFAGEIGHAPVGFGPRCGCGAIGCLEAVASARAIATRYSDLSGARVTSAAQVIERLTCDEIARSVWDDALEGLATALSWSSALSAPDVVVLGGGLARSGGTLIDSLRSRLEDRLSVPKVPELRQARLGDRSAIHGAALLAEDLLA
ncbi:ROK family protein [Nesterenkonia suensis]